MAIQKFSYFCTYTKELKFKTNYVLYFGIPKVSASSITKQANPEVIIIDDRVFVLPVLVLTKKKGIMY